MSNKEQFCFYCGESLGVYYASSRDLDTCGAKECEKQARYSQECEREEMRVDAEMDDYERYRERY